jgi:hypothetical protein
VETLTLQRHHPSAKELNAGAVAHRRRQLRRRPRRSSTGMVTLISTTSDPGKFQSYIETRPNESIAVIGDFKAKLLRVVTRTVNVTMPVQALDAHAAKETAMLEATEARQRVDDAMTAKTSSIRMSSRRSAFSHMTFPTRSRTAARSPRCRRLRRPISGTKCSDLDRVWNCCMDQQMVAASPNAI